MAKRNNNSKYTIYWETALWFAIAVTIAYLIYERFKNQKLLQQQAAENQGLKNTITNLNAQQTHWMNLYFNQLSWQQQYQLIPNPEEAVKDIIEKLQNVKSGIFVNQPDFCQELDDAIHALKGEKLNLSFFSLAKIIENLLKKNILNNRQFNGQLKKNITFYELIDFTRQNYLFDPEKIAFLDGLRVMRNGCAHVIAPEYDKNKLVTYHHWSIDMITAIEFASWSASEAVCQS